MMRWTLPLWTVHYVADSEELDFSGHNNGAGSTMGDLLYAEETNLDGERV